MSQRFTWRDGDRSRVVELTALSAGRYRVAIDGIESEFEAQALGGDRLRLITPDGAIVTEVTAAAERRFVRVGSLDLTLERERDGPRARSAHAAGGLEAPMPGVVTRVLASAGDAVKKGQPLVALEAMKMEHLIRAPRDGRVRSIAVRAGEMVNGGVSVAELEDES